MKTILNYIGGEFTKPKGNSYLDVYDPSNAQVYAKVPDSDEADMQAAIAAAEKAFPSWSATSLEERHEFLMRISKRVEKDLEELALAESMDNGKPLKLARTVDIPRVASNFRFFATALMQFSSESHEMNGQAINYTLRRPLGVVGCISPWNLPLYLFSWKIAPALAMGNTVVAKPSEVTPMTAFLLAKICDEVGLPKGVLNIVHGQGTKTAAVLSTHKAVKAVSFTGSTKVGVDIATKAAPLFKKLSLEMGGKNPNIIFADCDYNKMLQTTLRSSFANQGQICLCGSRIYIEKSIYEKFKTDFVQKTKALRIGHPSEEDSDLGAIVSKPHFDKIMGHIKLAEQEGGRILCGGKPVHPDGNTDGWYIAPTIIEGLVSGCITNQEEIFGPVVTLTPFEGEQEALDLANNSDYGLSATIWTQNLGRAHRVARDLEAGIVWVNTWLLRDLRTPFGGMKNSGVGREGGLEALRFFTEPKNVCIDYSKT
ncbi:aldehyde dehydrogenase [Flagellimonas flava]|uniref:Aminomuconate-semialdehyde/2-hydroxymuconate-6-semialdehyde dehydrogenase n=1 Tax=Flagellimonas flava TaxID=570519 RepID=A0A1M5JZS9_9FLAO|nr:aldehyde dehydrogenase [Allomuricauda flava]SHG46087.1 aminomuconate-semialdehyde/2-hydroxymuconate-6-semialdehyde dehydrogenase [Allomuricauda flava]